MRVTMPAMPPPEPHPLDERGQPASEAMPNQMGCSPAGLTPVRPKEVLIPLGFGRHLEVSASGDNAQLRVQGENRQAIDMEIRFDANGPVISVRAPTLEIEATQRISTVCDTFSVHARQGITLHSDGDIRQSAAGRACVEARRVDVEASPGAIRLKANDEVQVLGEMILLNCEHPSTETSLPSWASGPRVHADLPAQDASGDANVVSELLARERRQRDD